MESVDNLRLAIKLVLGTGTKGIEQSVTEQRIGRDLIQAKPHSRVDTSRMSGYKAVGSKAPQNIRNSTQRELGIGAYRAIVRVDALKEERSDAMLVIFNGSRCSRQQTDPRASEISDAMR